MRIDFQVSSYAYDFFATEFLGHGSYGSPSDETRMMLLPATSNLFCFLLDCGASVWRLLKLLSAKRKNNFLYAFSYQIIALPLIIRLLK